MEIGTDGALRKIEAASPAGLLTLHPEVGEGTLHGNVVRPAGMSHITLPWTARHLLLAGSSPVTGAIAATRLQDTVPAGQGSAIPAVEIADDLTVRQATWRVARVGERRWRLLAADGGPSVAVTLDDDGIPAALDDAETWPLELDPLA